MPYAFVMLEVSVLGTRDEPRLLDELRRTLDDADEALLCVAFANKGGVHLVRDQLRLLGKRRARLLATTTFGSTTPSALSEVRELGVDVRVFNPPCGSYHPKLYLTRSSRRTCALIASSNLTGGLANNYEIGTLLRSSSREVPIERAWELGESLWTRGSPWVATPAVDDEVFEPALYELLAEAVTQNPVFLTLGKNRSNEVTELEPTGLHVRTERSVKLRELRGRADQFIPAWMFQLAWDYLRTHGELSNRHLLDVLNVKRSSAVCAILARLRGVRVKSATPIVLEATGS